MCPRSCRRRQQNMAGRPFGPRCHPKHRYDSVHGAESSQQQQQQQQQKQPVWFPTQPGRVGRPIPATPAASPVAAQPIYEQQHPLGPPPPYTPSSDGILAPPTSYGKGDGGRGLPSEGPGFHQHAGFDEKQWIARAGEQDDDSLSTKRKSALERFTGLFGSATGDIKNGKGKDVAV
ncbi:hypothetical protein MAPG_04547 [Magnaporthiopsis poae ATCC 64411]|uniref:Uncharacterized protein n=1 Tax=Magnaporthiopsis poae (strain ATCC 64411 / 73-15) TaxID=644358 RepID=A0A0C4DX11_MAGP6|nr:hypothetical protein MAPG_04547 [Magnaporthiopsis poae ATCC 64411]